MQQYFIQNHRKLKHFEFYKATHYMSSQLTKRNIKWTGNLQKILDFFKIIIDVIILQKETYLTENIVETFLNQDDEQIQNIPNSKFVQESDENEHYFKEQAELINIENQRFINFLDDYQCNSLDKNLKQLIQCLNIDNLHPIQDLCLSYLCQANAPCFSLVGIGNGKTLICNILAAYFSSFCNHQVIVINKVKNLSQRNAMLFEQTLGNKFNLIVDIDGKQKDMQSNVIFLCEEDLPKYLKEQNKQIEDFILIVDEVDQILFQDEDRILNPNELKKWKDKFIMYKNSKGLYGFTGTLTKEEKDVIKKYMTDDFVIYPQINKWKDQELVQILNKEYSIREQWLDAIANEIIKKCLEVPIIILTQQQHQKLIIKHVRTLSLRKINIINLIDKNAFEINTAMDQTKHIDNENGCPVFLVDETIGRGLDLKTNATIEKNGGVYVIISKVPSSSKVLNKVKWRTQRLLNKGQYSYIMFNNQERTYDILIQESDQRQKLNLIKMAQLLKGDKQQDKKSVSKLVQNENKNKQQQNQESTSNQYLQQNFIRYLSHEQVTQNKNNVLKNIQIDNIQQIKDLEFNEKEFLKRYEEKKNQNIGQQRETIPAFDKRQTRQQNNNKKEFFNGEMIQQNQKPKRDIGKKRTYQQINPNENKKRPISRCQ